MKLDKYLRYLFNTVVTIQICGGIFLINRSELLFASEFGAGGPLRNNILFVVAYLTISELLLLMSRFFRRIPMAILFMGTILILTCVGMNFYASVNDMRLSPVVLIAGNLIGFVHLAYGIFRIKIQEQEEQE